MPIYVPSGGPDSWAALLADPVKHWREGYSARTLASCWEAASGLPAEIKALFGDDAELLLGIPEHKVHLPGGSRPSQTDLFALLRANGKTIAAAIEGKVDEPFGPTIGDWLAEASAGKMQRLSFLCTLLGLAQPLPMGLRYQLLHRTASAALESERFKTDEAAMIVHSFSPTGMWFDDFAAFASLFKLAPRGDEAVATTLANGRRLSLGWATGDPRFLNS